MGEPASVEMSSGGERRRWEPRYGVAAAAGVHAVVFAIAATQLPWRSASWACVLLGCFALGHAALVVTSLRGRERWFRVLWTGLSLASLVLWGVLTALMVSAGMYLQGLYQGLGAALAAGLFALSAVLALFTVPMAVWGLASLGPVRVRRRVVIGAAAGALILLSLFALVRQSGRASPMSGWGETEPGELWSRVAEAVAKPGKLRGRPEQVGLRAVECAEPVTGSRVTALVTWLGKDKKWTSQCVQADTAAALEQKLVEVLGGAQGVHSALVDFVVAHHELWLAHPVLDAFKIRPARDGVCAGRRCLAPWQLVAIDSFTNHRPLAAVDELRFGFSEDLLRRRLKAEATDSISRIETETYSLTGKRVERLSRLHRLPDRPSQERVESAVRAAERYILSAQGKDGRFRYLLNPFTGVVDEGLASLPRQAGTTLALCEVGRASGTRKAVEKSLALMATYERAVGGMSALAVGSAGARLGETALPLIAFLACRPGGKPRHDELIGRLASFLLEMQRDDGSFFPEYDLRKQTPQGDHEALYASGQAVLALVLLEQQLAGSGFGDHLTEARVRDAVDRAMDHYANEYWPWLLRDFFYLEENWHCLAARAALTSHRNERYEQFCLDYVAFKSRLILREGEVEPDLVGGYGVTPVFEPHNTGSAGFGEAVAAALAVQRARGEDTTANRLLMQDLLGFLLRAQWDKASCVACTPRYRVVGGFSEHAGSPVIRIDYVQHAMAALGHGGRELFEES